MKKYLHLIVLFFTFFSFSTKAQVSITNPAISYTQDFSTLTNSGAANTTLPTGWAISETGSNADASYAADAGGASAGNTFSYGTASTTERALGSVRSGSLQSTYGVNFVNNTGAVITSISVNYRGEEWRLGAASRTDSIHFQYSLDATSLTTGTWTREKNLDFITPSLTTTGAHDGNTVGNNTAISFTLNGLSISNGTSFWFQWVDADVTGVDDGLAIDDITITFNSTSIPVCAQPTTQPTSLLLTPTSTSISGSFTASVPPVDEYLIIRSTSSTLSTTPVDGTEYTAGEALGGGTVVSSGSSVTFADAGLTANTKYYYFIFALISEDCTGGPNYLITTPLTNSSTTLGLAACTPPPASPTVLTLTPSNTSVAGSFTVAAGANRYLIVRSTSPSLSTTPGNGTTYSTGQALGAGTVVTYGTGSSFVATGLTTNTLYYFFVFAANGDCNGEPFYGATSLNANITTTNSTTGIPPGYYSTITNQTCAFLKTDLKKIISANTIVLTYTPGVLTSVETTDMHRNDANTADIVWDMYSDNPTGPEPYVYTFYTDRCGNYSIEGDCYNREHSFPQEWFGSKSYPMYSDLHHVFPTDGFVNGKKANFAYGEVSIPTYTSANGGKLGPNTVPGFTGTVFEPINAYKGDFARAQLYMITRYEDSMVLWKNNGNADDVLNGTFYPSIDNWYIQLLYKWHLQDPVSQKEIDRNNAIYALQGNRNPFIDHPEYVAPLFQCTVVPVTLIDFKATKNKESIVLTWYATREANFKNYEIERSIDGIHFQKIAIVEGQNLPGYSLTDSKLPAVKTVFYRLKMLDKDAVSTYSKVLSVNLVNKKSNALIYPNPATTKLTVRLLQPTAQKTELRITDITGRTVLQQPVSVAQSNIPVDVHTLSPGRYFVVIKNDTELINESFMIIK